MSKLTNKLNSVLLLSAAAALAACGGGSGGGSDSAASADPVAISSDNAPQVAGAQVERFGVHVDIVNPPNRHTFEAHRTVGSQAHGILIRVGHQLDRRPVAKALGTSVSIT